MLFDPIAPLPGLYPGSYQQARLSSAWAAYHSKQRGWLQPQRAGSCNRRSK